MEIPVIHPPITQQEKFTNLLNYCCQEFNNSRCYEGIPRYDALLAEWFTHTGYRLHLRLDFSAIGLEVYVPLQYFSPGGCHVYNFPAAERDMITGVVKAMEPERFTGIITAYAQQQYAQHQVSANIKSGESYPYPPAGGITSWPEALQQQYPAISFVPQAGVPAHPQVYCMQDIPAIAQQIQQTAVQLQQPAATVTAIWWERYLQLCLPTLTHILNKHGLACDLLPGQIYVQADAQGYPAHLYFTGQPFPFSAGDTAAVNRWADACIRHHLVKIAAIFGRYRLADEISLFSRAYGVFETLEQEDGTGLIKHVLHSNRLTTRSMLAANTYLPYPNPLHYHFFSNALIHPTGKDAVYSRYFPKEDITVSIRPFNLERDLEMVHDWFNREHAKKIWKMDWPLQELEIYYRTMLPGNAAHSYIGEINGEPTYNFEVYWVVRDMLCNYYDALPTDYGTHQFIAPTDPKKKFSSPSTQCMLDFVFAQPQVGKMVGEGSVESLAAIMNKAHVGFRIEKVIELPHKKANLNFCYREWYWAKFPEARQPANTLTTSI